MASNGLQCWVQQKGGTIRYRYILSKYHFNRTLSNLACAVDACKLGAIITDCHTACSLIAHHLE